MCAEKNEQINNGHTELSVFEEHAIRLSSQIDFSQQNIGWKPTNIRHSRIALGSKIIKMKFSHTKRKRIFYWLVTEINCKLESHTHFIKTKRKLKKATKKMLETKSHSKKDLHFILSLIKQHAGMYDAHQIIE